MLQVLFIAFLCIVAINFSYFLFFGIFFFSYKERKIENDNQNYIPVSLIICAKNEASSLQENIPLFLKQSHPDFELILVNDTSADETLEVMEDFQRQDARIKIVNVQNNERFWGNKKYALTLGIKKAMHSHLIFTDADCKPKSNEWLSLMASQFSETKEIVLGYGSYDTIENSFLNKMIRYETLLTATQYFSYAYWGSAYMGVGRNLAYTSQLFYDHNGFVPHMNILSGDDDLFVNAAATSKNVALVLEKDGFTKSEPKNTWQEWYTQKRRHVSTASHYKPKHKFLLGLYFASQVLFWLLGAILWIADSNFAYWIIGFFIFKLFLKYIVIGKAAKTLNEKGLLWLMPFQEIVLLATQFGIFVHNLISKPVHWK
ncbi:glycosyltransferase [Mesonia ostreae]|uniref:Glycosyltransferase n=1 Tax=Mesonia ostreae TaxID=861110 RepID=A0ABU2KKX7_9FLAO|nr:glycosyltransferase [Mesonia ostreae]MDT0295383.1 glycosyltransferase [Mesonia ostreae]